MHLDLFSSQLVILLLVKFEWIFVWCFWYLPLEDHTVRAYVLCRPICFCLCWCSDYGSMLCSSSFILASFSAFHWFDGFWLICAICRFFLTLRRIIIKILFLIKKKTKTNATRYVFILFFFFPFLYLSPKKYRFEHLFSFVKKPTSSIFLFIF